MDEVDTAYKNSIVDALNSGNVDKLAELLNGNYEYAMDQIQRFRELNTITMEKIRSGKSTDSESAEMLEIVESCLSKANLSGYHM